MKPFHLIALGRYSGYCLTQAHFARIDSRVHFCTASTDGCIGLWPLDPAQDTKGHISDSKKHYLKYDTSLGSICIGDSLNSLAIIPVHQNSINCMNTDELSDGDLLITTVGDDGALAFTRVVGREKHDQDSELYSIASTESRANDIATLYSTLLVPKAHSSAISTVKLLDSGTGTAVDQRIFRLATCGKDQRLKIWRVSANLEKPAMEGFAIIREQTIHTSIADVSSLELLISGVECGPHVVVAGIGIERLAVGEKSE